MYNKKSKQKSGKEGDSSSSMTSGFVDSNGKFMDIKKLMRDVQFFGSSNMLWKERKELENRKVVSLGGKPPKKQRLPLSIARVTMKKQRERELEIQKENLILNRFERKPTGKSSTLTTKRRTEDKILKSSEGHFSRGVLNVKHLLQSERENSQNMQFNSNGKKKKGGKRRGGDKKKGGKRR
ncbi:hypothetical protein Sjap_024205 [Stephania japonica]|uniref:Uncharacterized protein n=1 Tax=Stephania japonica TaxID=461633 RepID=A0AAP0EK96_9MAGN